MQDIIACLLLVLTENDINIESVRIELCEWYTKCRHIPPVNDWPPYHPRSYIPSFTIHYEGTESIITSAVDGLVSKGIRVNNNVAKDIGSLFSPFERTPPFPYIVLIEGAHGMGKTILSKEIALQWANHRMLTNKELLFLISMHDPEVKKIIDIHSLVKYFCSDDVVASKLAVQLTECNGRLLTILLDGCSEGFLTDNKSHFIVDSIVGRKVLKKCGLIITSCPPISSNLLKIVDCHAELLGFTEDDRLDFINNILKNKQKVEQIKQYLKANPILNTLCYIPLNMSMLLCLANNGISTLPVTSTAFYGKFIMLTIVCFLKKEGGSVIAGESSLSEFPHPYDQVIKKLSRLAFQALQNN